jgi:rhodanese-related sulfurtransferase
VSGMSGPPGNVAPLSGAELKQRLDRGEKMALLDVREDFEHAICAIDAPPSVVDLHVPMTAIRQRFDEIHEAIGSVPVVVYCHHGVRSMVVAQWLARMGVDGVHNLEGGIDAWAVEVDAGMRRY